MAKVTDTVAALARPIVEEKGCSLWDVEYVKEAGEWFLRLYIDKPDGVGIDDCEAVSRPICWTRQTPSRAAIPLRCPPPAWSGRCAGLSILRPAWGGRWT